ncbi:MAG TPA: tetratricopeptide repeat protein [Candidatus Acidoferrum sp.]|nr:tetratricopeptide repeat protein [Candidatus Acidoferrum sp.]
MYIPIGNFRFSAGFFSVLTLLVLASYASAQRPAGPPTPPQRSAPSVFPTENVDVSVSVREMSGMPLPVSALVKLYSEGRAYRTASTQDGSTATFSRVLSGEYEIEVSATGYKTAKERASVFAGGAGFTVYIYLHPDNEAPAGSAGPPSMVMTPHLQGEIDKGLEKLRKHEFEEARKHFDKAAKMAPGNPDVQYLLGMLEYVQEHLDQARKKFESALSIYPSHERSLLALGELQLRQGESAAAAQTLEKAYQLNGADWRTHLLLANAYFQQKNYEKALLHATQATEKAKEHGATAWLLLGRILVSTGKRGEAERAFQTVIRSFPNDSAIAEAKSQIAELKKPAAEVAADIAAPVFPALEPSTAASLRPWAPPDIDSKEYPVALDVTCKESEVIQRAQARTARQLRDFEKFLATEHIEHQELDAYGNPGPPRTKDFNYIVIVEHPQPGVSFVNERRDGGESLDSFPSSLATLGLIGLGVNIFDPNYTQGLEYRCEGLGAWRGRAAWQMRFEQKKGVPSQIRTWRNNHGMFPIPLKGRVWVAASSYDVLHVETDLREPVKELQLSHDHLIVDYGPVNFEKGKTTLWLPWSAEMFMELRRKRYHHEHTLTNYMLFSVDTGSTISVPKTTSLEEQQP